MTLHPITFLWHEHMKAHPDFRMRRRSDSPSSILATSVCLGRPNLELHVTGQMWRDRCQDVNRD